MTESRKRGGQPGNTNALKHGFYINRFSRNEKTRLKKIDRSDLGGEIDYLRVVIDRIQGILAECGLGPYDPKIDEKPPSMLSDEAQRLLFTLTYVIGNLNTCVKTYSLLSGDTSEFERLIEEGKFLARERLGINDYLLGQPNDSDQEPDERAAGAGEADGTDHD